MRQLDILGGVFRDLLFYGHIHANNVLEMMGGTGYNVYTGLVALNIDAKFHGASGDDFPVNDTTTIIGTRTGIFVCRNEKEALAVHRGANLHVTPKALTSNLLFATLECGGDTFLTYAKMMKQKGGMVVLDPSPVFEWKASFIEYCDVLIPNAKEYQRIKDTIPKDKPVFLKRGINGGSYFHLGREINQTITNQGEYPLGCGDAFDVAVIYGLLNHYMPEETVRLAVNFGEKTSFIRGSSKAVEQVAHDFLK